MGRMLKHNVSGMRSIQLFAQCIAVSGKPTGLLAATLLSFLFLSSAAWGQQAPTEEGKLNRPEAQPLRIPKLSPELEEILEEWEQSSSQIQSLEGDHQRFVYDQVFNVEKRAQGHFWYQAPDKGRIDIEGVDVKEGTVNHKKKSKKGQPYQVQSDRDERWICTGKAILQINDDKQSCEIFPIPPQNQGQNITDGPLPFLFGMKAQKAKRRYRLELGDLHDPEKGLIHLIAYPNWKQDAANWQKAEVLLDPGNYLPRAIRMTDPAGNLETVYSFNNIRKNNRGGWLKKLVGGNPFQPNLKGYKKNLVQAQDPNDQKPKEQASKPDEIGRRHVPSLIGLDWKKATKVLKQVGYEVDYAKGETADREELIYVVYEQKPAPKTPLPEGEVVTLTLYNKPEEPDSESSP